MKHFLLPALATIFLFSSCKKDDPDTIIQEPTPTIEGAWDGFYGSKTVNASDTSFYAPIYGYSMVIKAGGKVTVYNVSLKDTATGSRAEGTWVYSTDGSLVVDYTYVSGGRYIMRAAVDSKFRGINGKWFNDNNTVGGLFFMVKK